MKVTAPLEQRARITARQQAETLRRLQRRTIGVDSGAAVAMLPGQIDPGYISGDPMVAVNGSATLSGPYNHAASYTPAAGDVVLLAPVSKPGQASGLVTAYVVICKIA